MGLDHLVEGKDACDDRLERSAFEMLENPLLRGCHPLRICRDKHQLVHPEGEVLRQRGNQRKHGRGRIQQSIEKNVGARSGGLTQGLQLRTNDGIEDDLCPFALSQTTHFSDEVAFARVDNGAGSGIEECLDFVRLPRRSYWSCADGVRYLYGGDTNT